MIKFLDLENIKATASYGSVHKYNHMYKGVNAGQGKILSETIHETIISLPISPVMTDKDAQHVVEIVNAWN